MSTDGREQLERYHAERLIQLRGDPGVANDLAYHEDRGDGTPLCGALNRDWNGQPMHYAHAGPGPVTCASCARVAAREEERLEARGLEELEGEVDPTIAPRLPQFHKIFRPVLEVLSERDDLKIPELTRIVADCIGLDREATEVRLPSGGLLFENRIRWAALSLSKAELMELVGPSRYRITDDGRSLLAREGTIDRDLLLRTRPTYVRWHEDMGVAESEAASEGTARAGVWLVRAGRDGLLAPHFVVRSAVVIGWGQTGDLTGLSREAIAERVNAAFAGEGARQRRQASNTLFHLVHSMRSDDLVITPEPASRTLLLGWVAGGYSYLEEPISEHYNHSREMRWFARVSRDELSYGARNKLGTLLTLSRPSFTGELVRLAESHRDDGSPRPLEQRRSRSRAPEPQWSHVAIPTSAAVAHRARFAEFPTFSKPLMPMLDQLHAGELALPDFQRSFVWAPDATAELVISIMRGFPAGNLLFLRGGSSKFKTRPAEGGPPAASEPSFLILDGQQRLTSLYQALFGIGASRFFLDVGSLLGGGDVGESVRVLPDDRLGSLKEIEAQADALMLPLWRVRGGEMYRWIDEVVRLRNDDDSERVRSLLYDVQQAYVEPLIRYAFPVTELPESVELDAVCSIFETLNRTGKPLTTFELITARTFGSGLSLRDFWDSAVERHPILEDFEVDPVYLLQVIALRVGAQCKRSTILRLPAEVIEREWDKVVDDMTAALVMLRSQCGVLVGKWLPYRPLLIPLAGAWREVARATGPEGGARRAKLIQWFWCASFTGEYESSSATLAERDSPTLRAWLNGAEPPPVVRGFSWNPERWRNVTPRQLGLYKATMALILSQAPRDFHTGAPLTADLIDEKKIDDHHVFPRGYLAEIGRSSDVDSVLNHVLIDRATNIRIGKNAPSKYLAEIRTTVGAQLDAVLASHRLPFEPESPLVQDDYDAFLTWRLENLNGLLLETSGSSGAPVPEIPSQLRKLDERIERLELSLRRLIEDTLEGDAQLLPEQVKQKARERFATDARKRPGAPPLASRPLSDQLQYADLRELQSTITSKLLWPRFSQTFGTKEMLEMRFTQLAEIRNTIRHSRTVTSIVRNDGEAAISWFQDALSPRNEEHVAASHGKPNDLPGQR